jgi:adenylyltransferase/sulfurtransferase
VEALKLLAGAGQPVAGRLLLYDALDGEWRTLRVPQDPDCPVCGDTAT